MKRYRVCVVGAGWSGLAAAIHAVQDGHQVTVLEASRSLGGRARTLPASADALMPDGSTATLDNGQHILLGAYRETLDLMRTVGLDPAQTLLRLPLGLRFADGDGLQLPDWPQPWNLMAGLLMASGWNMGDKRSLVKALRLWRKNRFGCSPQTSVAELCQGIHSTVMEDLINPLCISALNTPPQLASGQVFLTVLHDSVFDKPREKKQTKPAGLEATSLMSQLPSSEGQRKPWRAAGSDMLVPTVDLGALFPQAAAAWLSDHGASVHLGKRAACPQWSGGQWQVDGEGFDRVIWATAPQHAVQAFSEYLPLAPKNLGLHLQRWLRPAKAMRYQSIATVYAHAPGLVLPRPMLALRSSPMAPAQFAFDRGQLGGPPGLLALVVSAPQGEYEQLESMVLAQAEEQLEDWLDGQRLSAIRTVMEKQATFSCAARMLRPPQQVAPGLLACGDYLYKPYPATLEGAVRSGIMAALALDETEGFVWKE
jgi:predicted NAD/FAD-binding protein